MMNIWEKLPKPFFVLAPMDDVTDTVFRRIVADCAAPDLFFTEFVSVDALQSKGRGAAMKRLLFSEKEKPLVAQIWGKTPENYYKTARELAEMGFAGIDINMGCPEKKVVKNGCCVALVNNRELAGEIIQATREGIQAGDKSGSSPLPLSVKTRLGFNQVDMSWPKFLLSQKLNALSIHGRTRSQMSKVPADWDAIGEIRKLRDQLSPAIKIVGNGDVMSRAQGVELAEKHGLDGIMIGRGIFQDPFIFANSPSGGSPWADHSREQKIALYRRHVELFMATWREGDRSVHTLNKFCKIYINGFDGARELRDKLMHANSAGELLKQLS